MPRSDRTGSSIVRASSLAAALRAAALCICAVFGALRTAKWLQRSLRKIFSRPVRAPAAIAALNAAARPF